MEQILQELNALNELIKTEGNSEELLKEKLRLIVKIENKLQDNDDSLPYDKEGYNTSKLLFDTYGTEESEITKNSWEWGMFVHIKEKKERNDARKAFLDKYALRILENPSVVLKRDFAEYYEEYISILRGGKKYPLWQGNGAEDYSNKLCALREEIFNETSDAWDRYKFAEACLCNAECNCPARRDSHHYKICVDSLQQTLNILGDTPEKEQEDWFYFLKGGASVELAKKIIEDVPIEKDYSVYFQADELLKDSLDLLEKLYKKHPDDHNLLTQIADTSFELAKLSKDMGDLKSFDDFCEKSLQEYEQYHKLTGEEGVEPLFSPLEDYVDSLTERRDYGKSISVYEKYGAPYNSARFIIESIDNGRVLESTAIKELEDKAIKYLISAKESEYVEHRFIQRCWPEKNAEIYYLLGDLSSHNNDSKQAEKYYEKAEQLMCAVTKEEI